MTAISTANACTARMRSAHGCCGAAAVTERMKGTSERMKLAKDSSGKVRSAITGNSSLYNPPEALETLSNDPSVDIRRAVAANSDCTPVGALVRLAKNEGDDIAVRFNAAHILGFYDYCQVIGKPA